jgi:hypothetical protein
VSDARSTPSSVDVETHQLAIPEKVSINVSNGGLVLLWPFLTRYFEMLGLADKGAFVDETARSRSVYLLQYLVCGKHEAPERELALNKLLCGMPFAQPLESVAAPAEEEKRIGRDLLKAVIQRWDALGNTSVEELQESFLMREGRLLCDQGAATLTMSRRAFDGILVRVPWDFDSPQLPWLAQVLLVYWK